MLSLEKIRTTPKSPEHNSSPRISFSADFLDDKDFISITPSPPTRSECEKNTEKGKYRAGDFEFLSNKNTSTQNMITADELFFEGKLLPYWKIQHIEKLSKISLKEKKVENTEKDNFKRWENNNTIISKNSNNDYSNINRVNWFIDDDPSPRPPSCTVLWKELLRLKKKQHAPSSLSPSSSSSSSASSSDVAMTEEGKKRAEKGEKQAKGGKKGIERTRSGSMRMRPMVNVPVCTQAKSNALPPLFPLKKGRLER